MAGGVPADAGEEEIVPHIQPEYVDEDTLTVPQEQESYDFSSHASVVSHVVAGFLLYHYKAAFVTVSEPELCDKIQAIHERRLTLLHRGVDAEATTSGAMSTTTLSTDASAGSTPGFTAKQQEEEERLREEELSLRQSLLDLWVSHGAASSQNDDVDTVIRQFTAHLNDYLKDVEFRVLKYLVAMAVGLSEAEADSLDPQPLMVKALIRLVPTTKRDLKSYIWEMGRCALAVARSLFVALRDDEAPQLDPRYRKYFRESLMKALAHVCSHQAAQVLNDNFEVMGVQDEHSMHQSVEYDLSDESSFYQWFRKEDWPESLTFSPPYSAVRLEKHQFVALPIVLCAVKSLQQESNHEDLNYEQVLSLVYCGGDGNAQAVCSSYGLDYLQALASVEADRTAVCVLACSTSEET